MSLNVYMDGAERARKRPGPLAVSLFIHVTAFFALINAPEIKLPEASKSEYKQAIEGKEEKLEPLLLFISQPHYRSILPFYNIVGSIYTANFQDEFTQALRDALILQPFLNAA